MRAVQTSPLRLPSVLFTLLALIMSLPVSVQADPNEDLILRLQQQVADLEERMLIVEEAASEFKAFVASEDAVNNIPGAESTGRATRAESSVPGKAGKGDVKPRNGDSATGDRTPVPPPTDSPTSIRAPFVVVDDSGREIFRVERLAETGKATVTIKDAQTAIRLGATLDGAGISIDDGATNRVILAAGAKTSYVTAQAGDDSSVLTSSASGGTGVRVRSNQSTLAELSKTGLTVQGSNGSRATLTQSQGKNMALRLYPGPDREYAAVVGMFPDGSGAVQVADNTGQIVAAMISPNAEQGQIGVLTKNVLVASINNSDMAGEGAVVVRAPSGLAVAHMTSNDGGGNVTTTNPGGEGVFSAGWNGQEGAACVNTKSGQWCMGKNLPLQH